MGKSITVADRKNLPHIVAARQRIEDLWARGTDYCESTVAEAQAHARMLHLDMDFTGECQLKCFYCDRTPDRYSDVPNRTELTTEQHKDIIRQARELGATTIEFPGAGEPMIDPGFWEILEYIHDNGMIPVVFTSGWHLNELTIDRLYRLGATIFIKHNSDDPRVQDKMVGVKGYGRVATRALHLLVERGFASTIPTRMAIDMVVTLHFQDMEEIDTIFRWCRDNNVHNYIMTLIPEGMADHRQVLFEKRRADELIEFMTRIDREEYGLEYVPSRPMGGGYRCRQVNVGLFVNLFGEVYDCNGLGRLLGHLRHDSLADIWQSTYARRVRQPDQNGFCLLRERQWRGVDLGPMDRKTEQYLHWRNRHEADPVMENALDEISQVEIHRRGARSRAVDVEILPAGARPADTLPAQAPAKP
ncbi:MULTISPECIES: radical SAM protein [Protofrankia]|uniref:Radical SAM domain protein n=1 Tax=Candidatus Protofrankia datiscae TaxID=2716812 RepID=F8AVQ0_9ACTN|nr:MULTISPECIES: radical SAM protein [Protofrankia]AEH11146.1 Radical SAM domain protein [Candidatus Protofrankia datiscae]